VKFKQILSAFAVSILLLALVAGTALAAWGFAFPINVVDTSAAARNYVPVLTGITGESLVSSGYMTATGTDTNMQTGSTNVPYMLSTTQIATVVPILGAGSQAGLNLYTGYSPVQTDFSIITGSTGYVTTADAVPLEPGDDFDIEFSGYVDTSDDGEWNKLIYKKDAFVVYISADGEITAGIIDTTTTSSVDIVPNAVGAYTNITSVAGASTHWEAVDDPPDTPDDATTRVYTTSSSQLKDAYNLESLTPPCSIEGLASVAVYFRAATTNASKVDRIQPFLRLGTDETTGTAVKPTDTNNVYITKSEVLTRPGGGDWAWSDFAALQVAIGLKTQDASSTISCTQAYVRVTYNSGNTFTKSVTATGVSSGVHTVKAYADGTYLGIIVDEGEAGEVSDTIALGGASVTDNANDWVWVDNDVMPYATYIKMTVSDVELVHYQPTGMITATRLPDRDVNGGTADSGSTTTLVDAVLTQADDYWIDVELEIVTTTDGLAPQGEIATVTDFDDGTDTLTFDALTAAIGTGDTYELRNDGVITWGENSDMTVTMGSVASYESTEAGGGEQDEISYEVPSPNIPSGWFAGGTVDTLPFYENFLDVSTETGIPVKTMYVFMIFSVAMAMGFGTFIVFKPMIFGFVVTLVVLWVGSSMGIIPGWVIFSLIVVGFGIIYMRRNI